MGIIPLTPKIVPVHSSFECHLLNFVKIKPKHTVIRLVEFRTQTKYKANRHNQTIPGIRYF